MVALAPIGRQWPSAAFPAPLRCPGANLGDGRPAATRRGLDCRPGHAGAQRAGDAALRELKKSPHLDSVRRGAKPARAGGHHITRRLCVTLLHAVVLSIT